MAAQVSVDTIVMLSPVPLLWKLKMLPRKRKGQILALCGFGITTMLAGYARLAVILTMRDIIFQDFSWHLPVIGVSNNLEMFLALVTACVPTANLFFKWAYNKPRIPAASPRRRKTIRKYRKKKDPNSTVDTVDTNATGDTYFNYDAEWTKGDTMHSDWSRTESLRPLTRVRTAQEVPDDSMKLGVVKQPDPVVFDSKDVTSYHNEYQPSIRSTERGRSLHNVEIGPMPRKSTVSLREHDEDEEDNFYEMLVPSDGFFPWGTGLRPRPMVRDSGENHELRTV
ncbi:hypothetical protein ABW19_dt0201230 [Dactylella cylindrospora]|nr:hypothetical protein ABW19_dt0201230 [Dactylella cylindrospora]